MRSARRAARRTRRGGVAVVDALDKQAVDRFVDGVVEQAGQIDISFNLISYGDVQAAVDGNIDGGFPSANHERHADAIPDHPGSRPAHESSAGRG